MAELDISTENCIVEQQGNVLIVTLNRPEAKNAFSPEMLLGMYKAWRLLDESDDLYCGILTANGDTFCAGMDLKAGAEGEHHSTEEFMALMAEVPNIHWQALLRDNRPNKPLILAVEGFALAGGTEILQGTDIRVGADNAVFGVTEVARGLYPMSGSTVRLRRQIPYCLAAEMLLCGDHITAQQALEEATAYVQERRQFDTAIADFQATQFKLADMLTELVASRQMVRLAASKLDNKDPQASTYCAMAKRFATDAGFNICNDALQLFGGYGYIKEYPMERHVRDTRVHQILEGTNEVMRVIVSRKMLMEGALEVIK